MVQKRSVLWIMLFTGVIVHMLNYSCLNIAVTAMIKLKPNSVNQTTFVAVCRAGLNHTGSLPPSLGLDPPPVVGEYEWEPQEKSTLMGSFSWFMGIAQLTGALLCQKYGGKLIFGLSNLSLGILTCLIPTAAAVGVKSVILIRCLQGIAGGSGIGVAAKALISKWVPPNERAKFLAIMAGLYCGASFSYYLNGYILFYFNWRTVFYTMTAISMTWCAIWYLIVYEHPRDDPYISSSELIYIEKSIGHSLSLKKLPVPWLDILTSVPVLVNTSVNIANMWTAFTFLIFIPTYLQEVHGFPSYKIGQFSSLPFILETLFSIIFAAFTDFILRKGLLSATNVRKFATFVNTIVSGVFFGCLIFGGCDMTIIVTLLTVAVMFGGASVSGCSANIVDMSPNFCAVIHGLQGVLSNTTGVFSPSLVGFLTNNDKSVAQWNKVFLVTAGINIVPGLLFTIFGNSNVQPWNYETGYLEKEREANLLPNDKNKPQKMILIS